MGKNFAVGNFSWDIYRVSPQNKNKSKYQSWYVTPCCGLEVQNPHQALKSVKGPVQYLWLKPQVGKNFAVGYFSWDIYNPTPKKITNWYLIPCCGFDLQNPAQALKSGKGPGNTFDLNPRWARTLPLGIFHGIYIEPPKKIQTSKLIFNTLLSAWGAKSHPGTYVS